MDEKKMKLKNNRKEKKKKGKEGNRQMGTNKYIFYESNKVCMHACGYVCIRHRTLAHTYSIILQMRREKKK